MFCFRMKQEGIKAVSKNDQEITMSSRNNNINNDSESRTNRSKAELLKIQETHVISKRSTATNTGQMLVNVTLLQYLDTGRWFLSVYNDDLRPHEIILTVEEAEGISTACPNDCSGHGSCYLGKCDCIDGFEGIDCSKSMKHYKINI